MLVEVAVNVVVDFAPNCTFVTVANPVPVIIKDVPDIPDLRESAVIFGAAPESPELDVTGASTCKQVPTPIPVGLLGTVPAGHVIACEITGTYGVKTTGISDETEATKAVSAAFRTTT
jgi:hypothetical protein